MKKKKKSTEPTNRFEIRVVAVLNYHDAIPVLQWLNIQHDGRPQIPLEETCELEHQNATHKLLMGREVKLTFETDKDGNWKLIEAKG